MRRYIEVAIANILEGHDVLYNEIDILTGNLGSAFKSIMDNVGRRASNTCAAAISTLAKQTFGEPLTIKKLAEYQREQI